VDGGIWLGVWTLRCGTRIPGRELSVGDPTRYGTVGLVIAICAVPTEVGDRSIATRHLIAAQSEELITLPPVGVLRYLPSWRVQHVLNMWLQYRTKYRTELGVD
jgi:hypothetical protein